MPLAQGSAGLTFKVSFSAEMRRATENEGWFSLQEAKQRKCYVMTLSLYSQIFSS
jgi:hypothetical protein